MDKDMKQFQADLLQSVHEIEVGKTARETCVAESPVVDARDKAGLSQSASEFRDVSVDVQLRSPFADIDELSAQKRREAGRYQLGEAAWLIAGGETSDLPQIEELLLKEAEQKKFPVYEWDSRIPFDPAGNDRVSYLHEAYGDALNRWLDDCSGLKIEFRFPTPQGQVKTRAKKEVKEWQRKAKELGHTYLAAWRKAGYEPTKQDVALYLEGEFSTLQIYGDREEVLDATYIERHALTGITGNPVGYKSKKPKVPHGVRQKLPQK